MFRKSSNIKDGDQEPPKPRSRGPKASVCLLYYSGTILFLTLTKYQLSTRLSDLGDRVRRIRTSPSQPNLPSHSSGAPSQSYVPPVPPRRVPLTPTSATNATFTPSSPKLHSVSPITGTSTDSPGTDIMSVSSTPVARTVPQLRSMDTLAPSPKSTSDARGHRSNPASPARKPPTTRSAILARRKAEAEAAAAAAAAAANLSPTGDLHHPDSPPAPSSLVSIGEPSSSIVVSPPQDAESAPPKAGLNTSVQMLLHAMELDALSSSLTTGIANDAAATSSTPLVPSMPAKQVESSLSVDNNQRRADSHSLFPRSYTLSTASTPSFATSTSTSSDHAPPAAAPTRSTAFFSPSSESFRRFDTVPATPPVPIVPEKYRYQPSASMTASTPELNSPGHIHSTAAARTGVSSSVAKSVVINEATPVDVELGIAIIGASKCGKSEFIWKGMKVWGLDPSSTSESHCGISIIKRVALPSTSTSSIANTSPPKPAIQSPLEKFVERERLIDDDSASTLHERRRIAKVTLYEVDSAALFAQRGVTPPRKGSAVSEDSGYGDGSQWVWPTGMPRIDGVMLCYDASNAKSTDRLDELCGASYMSLLPSFYVGGGCVGWHMVFRFRKSACAPIGCSARRRRAVG